MFRYDRLDELIKETGKKKNFLCGQINKGPTYLRDAKKQNTNIKGNELDTLASELGTTPEYLTGETDIKKPTPVTESGLEPERVELINEIKDMDIERVKAFLIAIGKGGSGK